MKPKHAKLIVEKINGETFVYLETKKHHKVVQPKRGTRQLDPTTILPNECNIDGLDNFHFVFDLDTKKPRPRKG